MPGGLYLVMLPPYGDGGRLLCLSLCIKRQADMEFLRRACERRYESEFGVYIICNLSRHVMDHHLHWNLVRSGSCPVEWCSVWRGLQDCLDHLRSKHDGTQLIGLKTLGKFFPPWTVSREFWSAAL